MCFSSRVLGKASLGKETISHISALCLLGIMEFSTAVLRIWGASAFSSFYPGFLSLQPKLSRSASASSYLLLLATQCTGSFLQMLCSDTGHLLEEMCGCRLLLLWPALLQGGHTYRGCSLRSCTWGGKGSRGVAKSPLWVIHCFDKYMQSAWQTPQVLLTACSAVRKSGNLPQHSSSIAQPAPLGQPWHVIT